MMTKETCLIHFMDGTSMHFSFEANTDDSISVANEVHRIVDSNTFGVEIDDKLMFFPIANIRAIEVWPAPAKLPAHILKGAKLLKP